jgi:hypothetical protein
MLDPDFSTLTLNRDPSSKRRISRTACGKEWRLPLFSKYTRGLHLDRRKANKSLIAASKAEPKVREGWRWRATSKQSLCLDTRAASDSERSSERSVHLRLRRSELLSIDQRKSESQPNSRLHVELNSGVDIELGAGGSHHWITDIAGTTDSIRDIGACGTERPARLSEKRQRSPIDEDRDESIAA